MNIKIHVLKVFVLFVLSWMIINLSDIGQIEYFTREVTEN